MGIAASSTSSSSPPPPAELSAPLSLPTADPPAEEDAGADGAAETTVVVNVAAEESRECQEVWCFCRFMKGGRCKEEFVAWDKCVQEAEAAGEEDSLERCHDFTAALKKCMDAHADYYEPILRAAEEGEAAEAVAAKFAAAEWCKARGWDRDCRFRWFMEGGGCKEEFAAWDKCVREAEASGEDSVEPCRGVTDAIWKCMDAHADYYEPILSAARAMAGDAR